MWKGKVISMEKQQVIVSTEIKQQLNEICEKHGIKKLMLVCDSSFEYLLPREEYLGIDTPYVIFNEFTPNPLYEDVVKGVKLFRENNCDAILAIGGGSSIDVAKCIKLFSKMDDSKVYLEQEYADNDVLLIAIPTTSGTGSESTRYAVIYYDKKKQSVTHESIIPAYSLLDYRNLITLPEYQKKCTMMDAFCQSIEAWWSVNATSESEEYSKKALSMLMDSMDAYLKNEVEGNENMMVAANYAGRAINIAQTTAGHAMSYKLTSLYGIPHGRAAYICLPYIWKYMWENKDKTDLIVRENLTDTFEQIAKMLKCESVPSAIDSLFELNNKLFGNDKVFMNMDDLDVLTASVNPTRLKNNPMMLDETVLRELYEKIIVAYR